MNHKYQLSMLAQNIAHDGQGKDVLLRGGEESDNPKIVLHNLWMPH